MDSKDMLEHFLASDQGKQAIAALTAQGISESDANQYAGHAVDAAHAHVDEPSGGLLGGHPGRNFFAGLAASFLEEKIG